MTTDTTQNLPRFNVKDRQLYDLELLMVEGFAPLQGFMNEADYSSVVQTMRLDDGTLFPIPIVLDVPDSFLHKEGEQVLLCDPFGNPLAILTIESLYTPDKKREAELVYGTSDETHPGVKYLFYSMYNRYVGGKIEMISLPKRHDFKHLRHTPAALKAYFKEQGWDQVVGFQTRNPMHRAHFEVVRRAHKKTGAPVLIHPVVGMTKPGDIDYVTRVRTYNVVCSQYGKDFTHLALLPLAMRMAGPREALWHAIIRRNYGCTHFITGRDHAGPGKDSDGRHFYEPFAARDLLFEHAPEIGVTAVDGDEIAYSPERQQYVGVTDLVEGEKTESISGTQFRGLLHSGEEIPSWFSFPECLAILQESVRRDPRPGVTLFFTGLSGAGKSTIAELLLARLQEVQDRSVTFLDGDVIRTHLSKGLTFSKEDRDENVKRVGFVASEIARHGGIVICSLIAPYQNARQYVRTMAEQHGVFVEVYVATSLEECERRDTKGLYAKARSGEVKNFTGISDPYEAPTDPELRLDTIDCDPTAVVDRILGYLREQQVI